MSSNHALARFGYYPDLKDEEELSWGSWVSPNRGALQIVFLNLFFFFLFEADLIVWGVVGGSVSLFFSPPLAKYFPSQFPLFF